MILKYGDRPFILMTVIILLLCVMEVFAQPFEEILFEASSQADAELLDQLLYWRQHPIKLNTTRAKSLNRLPHLTSGMVAQIIANRNKFGPYLDWNDFQRRIKIGQHTLKAIKPYLSISAPNSTIGFRGELRTRIQQDFDTRYDKTLYSGSPLKTYLRFGFESEHQSRGGILIQKDRGEISFNDHAVGYLEVRSKTHQSRLILGNLMVKIGQGLIMWGPYGLKKGADPITPSIKKPNGISGYRSADEVNYRTGFAYEQDLAHLQLSVWFSYKKLDGSLNSEGQVNSWSKSGLHRTLTEIENQGSFREKQFGGRIQYATSVGYIGLTGIRAEYVPEFARPIRPGLAFKFTGSENSLISSDFNLSLGMCSFLGEIATSTNSGLSMTTSFVLEHKDWAISASLFRFHRNFFSPYGHHFISNMLRNLYGYYFGMIGTLSQHIVITSYYSQCRNPSPLSSISMPHTQQDLNFRLKFDVSKFFDGYVQFRQRSKPTTVLSEDNDHIEQDQVQSNFRLELNGRPSRRLAVRSRFEWSNISSTDLLSRSIKKNYDNGWILLLDARTKLLFLHLFFRLTKFHTDSYNSRIYIYEPDLFGIVSIPFFFGKGQRYSASVRCKLFSHLFISGKFIWTKYNRMPSLTKTGQRTNKHIGIQIDYCFRK